MKKKKPKKIWVIYLTSELENDQLIMDLSDGDYYNLKDYDPLKDLQGPTGLLYAFTSDPEALKYFIEDRNMDMFYVKELKTNQLKSYKEFRTAYYSCELRRESILTSVFEPLVETNDGVIYFKTALTMFELDYIQFAFEGIDEYLEDRLGEETLDTIFILFHIASKKLKKAMWQSGILGLASYIATISTGEDPIYQYHVNMDELGVLLDYYGELFSLKKGNDERENMEILLKAKERGASI